MINKNTFSRNIPKVPKFSMNRFSHIYDGVSIELTELSSNLSIGLKFSSDGKNIYVREAFTKLIHQYTIPTAWYLSGQTQYGSFDTEPVLGSTLMNGGFEISEDGTKLFIKNNTTIFTYTLTTAWDITTAVYDNDSANINTLLDISQGLTTISPIVRDNGTKLYIWEQNSGNGYQLDFGTPYDVTTLTYNDKSTSYTGGASVRSFHVSKNGLHFYDDFFLRQYDFTTPFDISTASWAGYTGPANQVNSGGIYYSDEGWRFFTCAVNGKFIYQFSVKRDDWKFDESD